MTDCPFTRYAIVRNARSRSDAEAYLPDNYRIVHEGLWTRHPGADPRFDPRDAEVFIIAGKDDAGWTLDGYVIPRCTSGLLWVEEIDLSHPVMREVPLNA